MGFAGDGDADRADELFNDTSDLEPTVEAEMMRAVADTYPSIYELYLAITHDDGSVVGPGCDDAFEFGFALDLLLDGLERAREREGSADAPSVGQQRDRDAGATTQRRGTGDGS